MAWAKSATPTADLRLAEREAVRCAEWQQCNGSWRREYLHILRSFIERGFKSCAWNERGLNGCCLNERASDATKRRPGPWPLTRYATIASLTHLVLLAVSGLLQVSVTPAQASAGSTLGSPLHLGLLVFSGTAAALLMLAANHQRSSAPWQPFAGEPICETNLAKSISSRANAAEPDAATGLPLQYDGICQTGNADHWAELMARASHELRTPLNAVIGFSDVMQRELLGPIAHERYREYIAHIRESGFALLRSTEDTLALTNLIGKTDAAQLCDVELDPVVREAWLAVPHNTANPHIELIADVGADILVRCNKAALRQALINLFADAICRAAPRSPLTLQLSTDGGVLSVTLSCQCQQMKPPRHGSLHSATWVDTAGPEHKERSIATAPQDQPLQSMLPLQSELPLVMARALLTLQGAELTVSQNTGAQWSASITFKRVNSAPISLSAHLPTASALANYT